MGIAKRLTAVFVWILLGGLNGADAQSTPFNAESQTYRNHGWTYAIGYHAFSARPDSVPAVYQTVRPSGTIDTLHAGTWGHAGNRALRLGIGYWGIARRPLIWDRWFIELQGTRNAATSTFDGLVANADSILQPNTLLDSPTGSSSSSGVEWKWYLLTGAEDLEPTLSAWLPPIPGRRSMPTQLKGKNFFGGKVAYAGYSKHLLPLLVCAMLPPSERRFVWWDREILGGWRMAGSRR